MIEFFDNNKDLFVDMKESTKMLIQQGIGARNKLRDQKEEEIENKN